MRAPLLLLRVSAVAMMAAWFGGFSVYGGVVVPILHDALDSLSAGEITRRVTDRLNLIGLAAVVLWWIVAAVSRSGPRRWLRVQVGLLVLTSTLLGVELLLHRVMDAYLDAGRMVDFYPLHRLYLWASTLQWGVNLGLLAGCVAVREPGPVPASDPLAFTDGK